MDSNKGQRQKWTVLSGPHHGAATAAYTGYSTDTLFTPPGMTYTPATGYSGHDTLVVRVTDGMGIAADTTHIVFYVTSGLTLPPPAPITGATDLCPGATTTLANDTPGGHWRSSNTLLALADSATGVITGLSTGNVTITSYRANGCGASFDTTTLHIRPRPDSGFITATASVVCAGSTVSLTDTTPSGTWSSADTGIAWISATGTAWAVYPGVDTLLYSVANSCATTSALFALTVEALPIAGVLIGPDSVCIGDSISWIPSSSGGAWSVTNGNASVADGMITGMAIGIDTVFYTQTNTCGTAGVSRSVWVKECPLGLNEAQSVSMAFFPNPATDELNVHFTGKFTEVKIVDMLGREVLAQTPSSPQNLVLNVASLPSGNYILSLYNDGLKVACTHFAK